MKTIRTLMLAAAAVAATSALAKVPTTTDEARALVAEARAESAVERAMERPALEPVAPGDYQAAARNEDRLARFAALHRSAQEYLDGERLAPIAVDSQTTAQQEIARQRSESDIARYSAYLRNSPTAWMIHQQVIQHLDRVAQQ